MARITTMLKRLPKTLDIFPKKYPPTASERPKKIMMIAVLRLIEILSTAGFSSVILSLISSGTIPQKYVTTSYIGW